MSYLPHQIEKGTEVATLLKAKGVAYLAGEVRSGKTRTAFYALSQLSYKSVLWLTKKQAIPGIEKEIEAVKPHFNVHVTNYEQVSKLKPSDYDFVVVDESHNLATCGKPSLRIKEVRKMAFNKPVLLLSGTPSVETALGLYHQFCVTKHSPLPFKNFFEFFRTYGIPSPIFLFGRSVEQYRKAKPELLQVLQPYFVKMTQADAGITATAEDVVHKIRLEPSTLEAISKVAGGLLPNNTVLDTDAAIRMAAHQIEAGAIIVDGQVLELPNTEMVDYIRETFGDSPDVAVMAHFKSTRAKITHHLPNVHLYSSDGHAEGVDLSQYRVFVIANSGYSGSKFIQRRDRGTRLDVTTPRLVHHLVADGQLSEKVYNSVSNKRDYNLALFRKDFCLNQQSSPRFSST